MNTKPFMRADLFKTLLATRIYGNVSSDGVREN